MNEKEARELTRPGRIIEVNHPPNYEPALDAFKMAEGYLAALEGPEVKELRKQLAEKESENNAICSLLGTERDRFGKLETEMKAELAAERAAGEKLEHVVERLLDGLDANIDPERCGLAHEQWDRRIREANEALAAYKERQGEQSAESEEGK